MERPPHLAPLTDEILRLALRGLDLPEAPRVLDLCCGSGGASFLAAEELGARCTGVDLDEGLLRVAREHALAAGLDERMEFLCADARHVQLSNGTFDLVLALGGALTYIGRPEGLERIRQLLKPSGALLLSDLIYLDSPAPERIARVLASSAPGSPLGRLEISPAVRAVFEEGLYRYENERSYHELLTVCGFDPLFAFPVPESAWNSYYDFAARGLETEIAGGSPEREPAASPKEAPPVLRIPVEIAELAAFYCWGGRWALGYLVCGARAR